jgi:hypothetical protein
MPCLEELRLKTGQLVTEDWYDDLADILCELGYGGIISLYGYVQQDLIPVQDLLINLGIPLKRFKELHAGWGFFEYYVYVNNKLVLTDGDCITIGDIGATAQTKITTSIDNSTLVKASAFVPTMIGKAWDDSATAMADIFTPDLTALADGRLRVKMKIDYTSYGYIKFKHNTEATDVLGMLNAGVAIPAGCWHEFDFTCEEDDTANVQIDHSTTVTIIVYNIPNA